MSADIACSGRLLASSWPSVENRNVLRRLSCSGRLLISGISCQVHKAPKPAPRLFLLDQVKDLNNFHDEKRWILRKRTLICITGVLYIHKARASLETPS